jgi:hypothetical protein
VKGLQEFISQSWIGIVTAGAFIVVFITLTWLNHRKGNVNAKEILDVRKESSKSFKELTDKITGLFTGQLATKDGEVLSFKNGFQDDQIKEIKSISTEANDRSKKNSDEIKLWRIESDRQFKQFRKEFDDFKSLIVDENAVQCQKIEKHIEASKKLAGSFIDVVDKKDNQFREIENKMSLILNIIEGKNENNN